MDQRLIPTARRLGVAALVTAGLIGAQVGSAAAATSLTLADQAVAVARGAAVIVEVTASCDPDPNVPYPSSVNVQISQRAGSRTVTGFGSTNLPCTGDPETLTFSVVAGGGVFKKGVAYATANLYGPFGPGASASHEVTILRG